MSSSHLRQGLPRGHFLLLRRGFKACCFGFKGLGTGAIYFNDNVLVFVTTRVMFYIAADL
jgi:hypothetical protein